MRGENFGYSRTDKIQNILDLTNKGVNEMTFKQRRKALGYSVKAIAEKLGYSHRTVEAWDGGRNHPDSVGILLGYIEAEQLVKKASEVEK